MQVADILIALQRGHISRNRHFALLAHNGGQALLRRHYRLCGLGRRLRNSPAEQQRIAKQGQQICIEIQGLPGNGAEIAYISAQEAQALAAHLMPSWTLRALQQALGAYPSCP